MENDSLTPIRLLLLVLCTFWGFDTEGIIPFSPARMAQTLGLGDSTARASLRWLQEQSYISTWVGRVPGVPVRNGDQRLFKVQLSPFVSSLGIRQPFERVTEGRYVELYDSLITKVVRGELSHREFLTYVALLFRTNSFSGKAYPEIVTLATDLGMDVAALAPVLHSLKAKRMVYSYLTKREQRHKTEGQVWVLTQQWENPRCPQPDSLRRQERAILGGLQDEHARAMILQNI